ncbi:MAG: MucBP domain-containing protein, partial [Clostridia bacterium]|nr:MucBP domain-containing protein [Clostridia bacterium]
MTYAGEKRWQRLVALVLTVMMLLGSFTLPALADWQSLAVTLSWTDGAGNPVSAAAYPVSWSDQPAYWVRVTPEAMAQGMTLSVTDPGGQYTYTTPNGDVLTGVADAGGTIDGSVTPVTILAMDASGANVAAYSLYISTQADTPSQPRPEPAVASVTIQYVSDDGVINESETVTVTEGQPYTANARSYEGYDLISTGSVTVEVYSDGSANVNPVVFQYQKAYVPPKTADIAIQYVSDDGVINEGETVTVTEGQPYTANARSYEGYDLISSGSVTVEVYADGSASVN